MGLFRFLFATKHNIQVLESSLKCLSETHTFLSELASHLDKLNDGLVTRPKNPTVRFMKDDMSDLEIPRLGRRAPVTPHVKTLPSQLPSSSDDDLVDMSIPISPPDQTYTHQPSTVLSASALSTASSVVAQGPNNVHYDVVQNKWITQEPEDDPFSSGEDDFESISSSVNAKIPFDAAIAEIIQNQSKTLMSRSK
ncbi:hypothetical protein RCL1_005979 [Eukaryota sp. TZLM3-RCL]